MPDKVVTGVDGPDSILDLLPDGVPFAGGQINEIKQILDGMLQEATEQHWTVHYSDGSEEAVSLQTIGLDPQVRSEQALDIKNLMLVAWDAEVNDGSDESLAGGVDNILEIIPGGVIEDEETAGQSIIVQCLAYLVGPTGATATLWKYDGESRWIGGLDPEKAVMLRMANEIGSIIGFYAQGS